MTGHLRGFIAFRNDFRATSTRYTKIDMIEIQRKNRRYSIPLKFIG